VTHDRPIKVLHVVHALGMGGAETWLMEVLRRWSKDGSGTMDFLATSGEPGVFDDEACRLGARIHYVRYGRNRIRRFARALQQILRQERYAAIHDHQDYISGWHFLLASRDLPPVRVTHVHNGYRVRSHGRSTLAQRVSARVGKNLIRRHGTHIIGTSRHVIAEYGFDSAEFRHLATGPLYCGFDPTRFLCDRESARASLRRELRWPDAATIVLVAGRIDDSVDSDHAHSHKNSTFAVSVGIECARRNRSVRVLFAGKRSAAVPELERRISAAGFDDRFRFAGIRTDIARVMAGSDVLLFPSRSEGLGMAAVEAQAAGLPVLASDAVPRECVVVPQLVRFEPLVATPSVWADALLQLADQRRDPIAANRQVALSPFAIEQSSRALLHLYRTGSLA